MLAKIISGAQTGADRGGLDAALILGIPTGGYIPKGCRTEKGNEYSLRLKYNLIETLRSDYPPRTELNVQSSDATIWVGNVGSAGYWCTKNAAVKHHKDFVINPTAIDLRNLVETGAFILNVAGNRESTNPGIYERTKSLILEAFADVD